MRKIYACPERIVLDYKLHRSLVLLAHLPVLARLAGAVLDYEQAADDALLQGALDT